MREPEGNVALPDSAALPAPSTPTGPKHTGLLQVCWRRRWFLAAAALVCLAGGILYLAQATPIFTAVSRLYVEQSGPKIISDSPLSMARSDTYLNTQCELLKSTPILASACEQPGIRDLRSLAGVSNPVAALKRDLSVLVGKKDDIINISLDSPYPEEAAQIVNTVVEAYVAHHARQKRSTAAEVLRILQKEKAKQDADLDAKLKVMLEFKRVNGALSFENDKGNILVQQLTKLSEAMTMAQLEAIDAKATYEATKAMMDEPGKIREFVAAQHTRGVYVATSNDLTQLQEQLRLARAQLDELARGCTPETPAYQAAAERAARLKEDLSGQEQRYAEAYLAAAHQQSLMADQKQAELRRSFDQQQKLAQELNVKAAEYAVLQTDLRRTERLCDILDSRIKEINVTEDAGALNISILEAARAAEKPSRPVKGQVLGIALAFGLLLGVGTALLADWKDQRLRTLEEVTEALSMSVLGVVPGMPDKKALPSRRGQAVRLDPHSGAAEAYRTVRTAVYFAAPGKRSKTLLVTSPTPGDGKSTLSSNLAITMAQAGQRTILLDADFRKPTQHLIFDLQAGEGLSSVLAGHATLESVTRATEVKGLDVLPCGQIPPNPSEMLGSEAFTRILRELSGRYDYIVIDSPPVLPVTDARILGALCDLTLLVLRADKSTRKAARQAKADLLGTGSRLLGAVINGVTLRKSGYGHYGEYGYGYGYGKQNKAHRDAA